MFYYKKTIEYESKKFRNFENFKKKKCEKKSNLKLSVLRVKIAFNKNSEMEFLFLEKFLKI